MRRISLQCLLLASLLAVGCAFTPVPLTLPQRGLDSTVPGGKGRSVVVVVPFVDAREIKERCGMQKNGYGMDTAPARCQSDPAQWIAALLAEELRASGCKVIASDAPREPHTLVIEGSLRKLFAEPVLGVWSGSLETDLEVELVATTGTGLRATRRFFAKGVKQGVIASTLTPFHTSLDRATQEMISRLVTSVIELLDRYPQLGVGESGGWVIAQETPT